MKIEPWEQLIRHIEPEAKLLRAQKLQGGVSAQVTKLEIELPEGVVRKLLARRHGEVTAVEIPISRGKNTSFFSN